MRLLVIGAVAVAAAGLGSCNKPAERPGSTAHHGRYVGIGIYNPGQQWTKMVAADAPKETPAARTIDDQAIIVVLDSDTGEVRSCGDLTGHCIGMNPWRTALPPSQLAPISLTEHVKAAETEHGAK